MFFSLNILYNIVSTLFFVGGGGGGGGEGLAGDGRGVLEISVCRKMLYSSGLRPIRQ